MLKLLLLLAVAFVPAAVLATNWAILAAGSNDYDNYRHQANICHAHQVLRQHGFPPENIVTMLYDDIANSPRNPVKGELINKPNGTNVYAGVVKDYVGTQVTADNFLAALNGTGKTGKVLHSTADDNVFVYYTDHGAPGYVAFPTGKDLYADQLLATIQTMHQQHKFKQMLVYWEACHSGSMINKMPDNIDVFAIASAEPDESTYATYYDEKRQTYLGDEFSVAWMEDSDAFNLSQRSLQAQTDAVAKLVTSSHVVQFGNKSMGGEMLELFQAFRKGMDQLHHDAVAHIADQHPIASRDVPLAILSHRAVAGEKAAQSLLQQEIRIRKQVDEVFEQLVHKVVGNVGNAALMLASPVYVPTDFECLRGSVDAFQRHCGEMRQTPYAYGHVSKLVALCEAHYTPAQVDAAATVVCRR